MFWTPYGFNNSGIVWRDALPKPTHALPHRGQGAGCDYGVLVDLRGDIPGEGYAECDGKQPGENASERVSEGQPRVAALPHGLLLERVSGERRVPAEQRRSFSPFVPVTSQPLVVPTSPIDQPARCRRSWQAAISAGPDMAAMVRHGRHKGQGSPETGRPLTCGG